MSGTQKPHFAVDLNEIERQLAQAQSPAPVHSSSGGRHDPLADLARIVGQDDPFEAMLANEAPRGHASQQQGRREPLFAVRGNVPDAQRGAREPAPFNFEDEFRQETQRAGQSYAYQQPVAAEPAAYDQQAYDQGGYSQEYYDDNGAQHATQYDESAYQPPPRRSRKAVLALGAVLGVVALGSAGAFMFSGGSAAITGEPPLIAASNEPIKVAPQNPGGVEIPNQNKQIYERAQSGQTKVVSNSEQPVDVKQTVRMNGGTVADATGSAAPASAPQAAPGLNLGEPRKVRTIAIKPDGTLARPEPETKTAAVAAAPPAMTMPAATQPASAPAAVTPTPAPRAAAATPAAATPAAKPAPVAAAQTPAVAPQRVASVQPTAPAAVAPADASVGGFSVQLAVRGSEKDAQAAFSQFQKKYTELAGQQPLIRKADVNGTTVFRVRAGPMSRDDASQLCSSVQGQGGQCFVAKN